MSPVTGAYSHPVRRVRVGDGCWVAVNDSGVVGHVVLTAVGDCAEVERLFVDPLATRQGIGRQLLDHCFRAGPFRSALDRTRR